MRMMPTRTYRRVVHEVEKKDVMYHQETRLLVGWNNSPSHMKRTIYNLKLKKMKQVIKLGDCGWSYITENEEAADAIEKVVYEKNAGEGFTTSDYNELSSEAKEVFDDFASSETIWISPYDELIWEEALKRSAINGGWVYDEEDLELEGYRKWN